MEKILAMFQLTPTDLVMIFVGAFLFVYLWSILDKVLFGPYLKLIEARERATTGADKLSLEQTVEAENLRTEFEEKLGLERVEAVKVKLNKVAEAKAEAAKIVAMAEKDSQIAVKSAREEMQARIDAIGATSQTEAAELARLMVEKVKAGIVGGALH